MTRLTSLALAGLFLAGTLAALAPTAAAAPSLTWSFETGLEGWTIGGDGNWFHTNSQSTHGSWSMQSGLHEGTSNSLLSPPVTLGAAPTLTWDSWDDYGSNQMDTANVRVFDGVVYHTVWDSQTFWTEHQPFWTHDRSVSLAAFAGQTVAIEFFWWDCCNGHVHSGWFVDEIVLMDAAPAVLAGWFPADNGSLIDVALQNTCPDSSEVPISDKSTHTWVADQPAQGDVNLGADPFTYHLVLSQPFAGTARMEVGVMSGSTFTPFAHANLAGGPATVIDGTFTVDAPQIVPGGDYLAFRIINTQDATGGAARRLFVVVGCYGTNFQSGESDPGYPTPEMMTLALVSAGVVAVGAVALRRRQ